MRTIEALESRLFSQDEGTGSPVVLLHGSASSGRQWSDLTEQLKRNHRVIVPDLRGYGRSHATDSGAAGSLDDDVEAIFALIEPLNEPVDLVGHSFGGAVAMKVALRWPEKVKSLTIIEPVLFHLLRQDDGSGRSLLWQVKQLSSRIVSSILDRDPARGMQQFVDFWNGPGSWSRTEPGVRDCLTRRVGQVQNNFNAVYGENWPLRICRGITSPVLAIMGGQSVAATRRITELLADTLPNATLHSIEGAGHMAPVTHGRLVNRLIMAHLAADQRAVTGSLAHLQPAA